MTQTREKILDAATMLFGRHGYHAVGVDWIIAESGVAKMTMYRYFPSKIDLVTSVLSRRQKHCADSLKEFVSEDKSLSPLERLKCVFDWHHIWFNSDTFSGCMFMHAAGEFSDKGSTVHNITVQQKDELVQFIRNIIVDIVGEARSQTLASALVMLLDGATLSAQVTGQTQSASIAWETAKTLMLSDASASSH